MSTGRWLKKEMLFSISVEKKLKQLGMTTDDSE